MSIFNTITDMDNVEAAYKQCMRGKGKYKNDAIKFDRNYSYYIAELLRQVEDGSYRLSDYISFRVYEPKERQIYAPVFRDKLVQVMVYNAIKDIYNRSFISDSYACIDRKGTHAASARIQHFLRKAYWEYGAKAHILKIDVQKYFYSIDREILKSLLPKKIPCPRTLNLLCRIIDSSPDVIGLPLGNITSHVLANIYLNELDQYCKRALGVRYYVRYMDDVFIVAKNKATATDMLTKAKRFLETKLNLTANVKKTKIFPINQGVSMVGFKTHRTHKLLKNDSKKKVKRKLRKMPQLIAAGKMDPATASQMLGSWSGHAMHGCHYNFMQKLTDTHPWISVSKGIIKVDKRMKIGHRYDAGRKVFDEPLIQPS